MGFETESEMKEVASGCLSKILPYNGIRIFDEFDYGLGRTDLVFVNISDEYWSRRVDRLDLPTPITDRNHLITFLQLHGRGEITEDYFHELGALDRKQKGNSLDWLRSNGFVQGADGKIRTTPDLRRHITTTVAVELKLRKWKKALMQASRGRSFADYKYVVVDSDHVAPALENIGKFETNNVGLIGIDETGSCTIHYEPARGNPHSDLYRWKLNEKSIECRLC